jgi:hypothetical protein
MAEGLASIRRRQAGIPPAGTPAPAAPRELVSKEVHPIVREVATVPAQTTQSISNAVRSVIQSHGLSEKGVETTLDRLGKHDPTKMFSLE